MEVLGFLSFNNLRFSNFLNYTGQGKQTDDVSHWHSNTSNSWHSAWLADLKHALNFCGFFKIWRPDPTDAEWYMLQFHMNTK